MTTSVASPRFVIEPSLPSDDPQLRVLLRETPMGGAIEVAFLREPHFFTTTRIQGTWAEVHVARQGDRIVAVATRAVRPTYLNGARVLAGYLSDLRLHPDVRGTTLVARLYRGLREQHRDGRVSIYSTVIVGDNQRALDTIAANRAGLPRYTDLGRILTPMIYLQRPLPALDGEIRSGTAEDLPAIVAKLNENRMQFAPAYTESDFLDGRFPEFRIDDFYVLRRAGRLAGVLGVWDQRKFRQTVVMRYRGLLGKLRPVINWMRRPPLPPPGEALKFFYVAFVATDDVAAYRALFRRAYNDAVGHGYTHFVAGLHERDPRTIVFEDYARTPFAGRLFAVTLDGPANLDDRVPYMEAALL